MTARAGSLIALLLSGCAAHPSPVPSGGDPGAKPFAANVRDVLDAPTRFELLTLETMPRLDGKALASDFHEYPVIGRATLEDPSEQQRLVDLVYRGVEHSNGNVAACFNPRHGISATRGDRVVDLVICYECLQIKVFPGDDTELTADDVLPEVNAIFAAQGLQLSPEPE